VGCRVDNGNHLVVSGNAAVMAYVAEIGAASTFDVRETAAFPFLDLRTGERWNVAPTDHRFPFWLFLKHRRVAGTRAWDYLQALKLRNAGMRAHVAEVLPGDHPLFDRRWRPPAGAAVEPRPGKGSGALGGAACSQAVGHCRRAG